MIALEPRNAELRNKLAKIYIERGNMEEARRQIATAQQLSPDAEVSLIMLGRISRKQGSVRSALDSYRAALNKNPRNVNAQLELGSYFLELRRWSDALQLYQNALMTSPNDLDLIERYAWALAVSPLDDSGNGRKALELANRLTLRRKYTKDQEMRCGVTLAAAYARTRQFDAALEIANKYIGWARTMRDSSYLHRLEVMTGLFHDKKPYVL
jgi:tetratricopeptide (TPR) repeat protein